MDSNSLFEPPESKAARSFMENGFPSIVLVNDSLAVKRKVYGHLVKPETGTRVVSVLS
jgi:hypothetical protein